MTITKYRHIILWLQLSHLMSVFLDALVIADVYGSLFVLFHLAIVLYVLLTTSDYLIGIFKLFLRSDKVNLSFVSCLSFLSWCPLTFFLKNIHLYHFDNLDEVEKIWKNYKKKSKRPKTLESFFMFLFFYFHIDVEWQYLVPKIFPKCV